MRAWSTGLVATMLCLASPLLADEPDKARCVAAYERAQELQRQDALNAARKQLVICSETCPPRISRDCLTWIDDVDAVMPTIVLRPRDATGRPIPQARVSLDGELIVETIDPSKAIAVDPGTHVLHFEHPDFVPADVRVTVHGAERGREVALTLWPKPETAEQPGAVAPAARSTDASSGGHRSSAYAFGIGGLAALAIGGSLAIAGHVMRADLLASCAPTCPTSDADTVVALWRFGGAAAAIGAVSLGIATYLWFAPQKKTGTTTTSASRYWVGTAGAGVVLGRHFD